MDKQTAQARTLYILWIAFFLSNGIYFLLAYFISQGRTARPGQFAPPADPLTGLLSYLPLALPLLLLPLGLLLWEKGRAGEFGATSNTKSASMGDGASLTPIGRTQVALILMMAVYEANTLIGLVLFFIGTPLIKFGGFVLGTGCLMLVVLQKLLDTLAR